MTYKELLQQETFILWRLFPTEESDNYWKNLQEKNPTLKDEIALADGYLRKNIFTKRFLKIENKDVLLNKIHQSIEDNIYKKNRKQIFRYRWIKYAAAACVIALISTTLFITYKKQTKVEIVLNQLDTKDIQLITGSKTASFSQNIDIQINEKGIAEVKKGEKNKEKIEIAPESLNKLIVPFEKRSKITLADGTKVWLNSGSTLEFPSQFAQNKRKVNLSGEMYIEVTQNKKKPFYVQTSLFEVEVYGTKFNVSTYKGQSQSVALLEGSVGIKQGEQLLCKLKPNEVATYKGADGFNVQKQDISKYISWINGYIIFEKAPISEVLEYIERYYNLSLNYSNATNLKNMTCNGKLYLSDNLDNVMRAVAVLNNTTYKKEHNNIYLYNKPE